MRNKYKTVAASGWLCAGILGASLLGGSLLSVKVFIITMICTILMMFASIAVVDISTWAVGDFGDFVRFKIFSNGVCQSTMRHLCNIHGKDPKCTWVS